VPKERTRSQFFLLLRYRYIPARERIIRKNNVWQMILPLENTSLKKSRPRGLSIISGRSEPTNRTLISICLARELKRDGLDEISGWVEEGGVCQGCFLFKAASSTIAVPRVIPVCPSINILK